MGAEDRAPSGETLNPIHFCFKSEVGEANDLRLPLSQGHSRGRPYPQRNKNEAHPNRDPFRWVVVGER